MVSGSQRSYITNHLKRKLGLIPKRTETLNLNTFGNKKFSKRDCDLFKLRLQGKHGVLRLSVHLYLQRSWNMQFSHSQPPLFSAKLKDEHDQCSYEMQILLYCWNLENKNQEQDAQKFNKKCPDNCWKTPQNPMPQRPMLLKISKIIICYRYFLNNSETAITTVLGDK